MSPSPVTIRQIYSCTEPLYSSSYFIIRRYNYPIYAKTVSMSFLKRAEEYNITEPPDTAISTWDTIPHLKNLLTLSSIVFLEWRDKTQKEPYNFATSSKMHLFPLPSNLNGTRKYESYTRNSFRTEHRADLSLSTGTTEQSNHCALQAEVIQSNCICLSILAHSFACD